MVTATENRTDNMRNMLEIVDLTVTVGDKTVLKGLNLSVEPGTVHVIMGPNGSGKSTLSHVLAGKPGYSVTHGSVLFHGQPLLDLPAHERALAGLFLGFQYPVEIPGLSNMQFLKAMLNAKRQAAGKKEIDAVDFLQLAKKAVVNVGLTEEFLYRSVNHGFSGGEKKRNELLQLFLLEPDLVVLDELDSGLDRDAMQLLVDMVQRLRTSERAWIIVTHYNRLLDNIAPDYVHILKNGRWVASGGPELLPILEERGYAAWNEVSCA